jgi:hypothetical protein
MARRGRLGDREGRAMEYYCYTDCPVGFEHVADYHVRRRGDRAAAVTKRIDTEVRIP